MKRTAAIYILAIIAVLAGIVALVDTTRYLGWLYSPLDFVGSPFIGAILTGLLAAMWFSVANLIWIVNLQGWFFMVALAIVVLFIDLISFVSGTPIELLLPSILISGLVLILGLLPSTRRAFGTGQLKD